MTPRAMSLGGDHAFEADDWFGLNTRVTLTVAPVVEHLILNAFRS